MIETTIRCHPPTHRGHPAIHQQTGERSRWNLVAKWGAVVAAVASLASPLTSHAAGKIVKVTGQKAGGTPFVGQITVTMDNPASLDYYRFTVQPKEGSQTRPISARYSAEYLQRRGFLKLDSNDITLPVYGLYAGRDNRVTLSFGFVDGRSQESTVTVSTASFAASPYSHPEVIQARKKDTTLSFDFLLLKNYDDPLSPVIMDTDGEVRWVGTVATGAQPCLFLKNGVYVIVGGSIARTELDGEATFARDLGNEGITNFHHNFDYGRDGILIEVDTPEDIESINMELDLEGNIIHRWDFAKIISEAMTAGGDDPSDYVDRKKDWFHTNSMTYRASDNTLLVSSRESYVIAVDYDTQEIKWILGGQNKKWYQYPSLRKYALNPGPNSVAPIGQHALSIDRDRLLLFDNGYQSIGNVPTGKSRKYSAPRMYQIDTTARTATEVWSFLNDKSIYSPICSSVYSDKPNNYLIDYTTAGPYLYTKLVGVDASGEKVFDYQFSSRNFCAAGWNANPIHLEDLSF